MNLRLYNKLEKRYSSLRARNKPSKAAFMEYGGKWDRNGRLCEYCHRKINLNDNNAPYSKQLSLDHRLPLVHGGDDRLENLALVCNRCNLIKSTMTEETYREFLYYVNGDEPLLEKILLEIFKGRVAYKLERIEQAADIAPIDLREDLMSFYLPPHTALFCPDCRQPLSAYMNTGKLICLNCSSDGIEKTFIIVQEEHGCNQAK